MKCNICGGNVEILTEQTYHYNECGLDNIYLNNIETEVCQKCSAVSPRLPYFNLLHKLLATKLIAQNYLLSGKEIRFLRKERGQKLQDWAVLLGIDPNTLSKLENSEQPIDIASDRAIRLLYLAMFQIQEKEHFTTRILNVLCRNFETRIEKTIELDIKQLATIFSATNDLEQYALTA